jgi:mannose-6-phosphate isomerase-like protein (cupin superfamily)
MPRLILQPTVLHAAGQPPKVIEEYFGGLNSQNSALSIARMKSPSGWSEPAQTPEFDEYTVVLQGVLTLETDAGKMEVGAGQAVLVAAGERVRYSTPHPDGAEYIAVCLPAFSPAKVHRE